MQFLMPCVAQVTAPSEAFQQCQMPDRYLQAAAGGRRAVTFRLQVARRVSCLSRLLLARGAAARAFVPLAIANLLG